MTHKFVLRLLTVCLLSCMAAVVALGQDHKALLGKWDMTSETEGDPVKWALMLRETDGKLTASLVAGENEIAAKDFSYADGVLKFKVPYQGEDYIIELKANAEKLVGTWTGGGGSGRTTGTKS